MASGEEVEGPVLAAVGRLELVPQAELPLVLQLQPDDGLPQGAPVLADHTQRGTWGVGGGGGGVLEVQGSKVKGQMESGQTHTLAQHASQHPRGGYSSTARGEGERGKGGQWDRMLIPDGSGVRIPMSSASL